MKHSQQYSLPRRGFTLIELSIVLVIIGLIVGGILVGRDLIEEATLRKDIATIRQFQTAINTFKIKYNCLPGDCAIATNFFSNTENGNGDGQIGLSGAYNALFIGQNGEESSLANEHLADSGLISLPAFDRQNASSYTGPNKAWVQLSSYFGGVFPMSYQNETYLLLNGVQVGGGGTIGLNYAGSSPQAAFFIDSKIDDGLPTTGKFTARAQLNFAPGFGVPASCVIGNGVDVFINQYNTLVLGTTQCNLFQHIDF